MPSEVYDQGFDSADDTTADDGRRAMMRYCNGVCSTTNILCVNCTGKSNRRRYSRR